MTYKDIIKNRKLRIKIMQFLSFVPDELMIRVQYKIKTGRKLNLKNPQRFTEKLQWYKLNYRNPLMAQCADKYDVRKYVEDCGLGSILNEMYGVYDSPDEVDFSALPNEFVIKDTLGGGGNAVIIVSDKSKMDEEAVRQQMSEWVNEPIDKKSPGREWVYDGRMHRILIEKYLSNEEKDLPDYKFYLFNGELECFYIRKGYNTDHVGEVVFYNANFEPIDVGLDYAKKCSEEYLLPANINDMVQYAQKLAQRFPHVRVDFYLIKSQVYFGELTFFNASGYFSFEPDEFDYELGKKFILNKI